MRSQALFQTTAPNPPLTFSPKCSNKGNVDCPAHPLLRLSTSFSRICSTHPKGGQITEALLTAVSLLDSFLATLKLKAPRRGLILSLVLASNGWVLFLSNFLSILKYHRNIITFLVTMGQQHNKRANTKPSRVKCRSLTPAERQQQPVLSVQLVYKVPKVVLALLAQVNHSLQTILGVCDFYKPSKG